MVKLCDAEWTKAKALQAVVAALDGEARFVGGAVRDTLLGQPVKDVDLATPLLPQDVIAKLEAAAIKAIPTGIEHGTVTAVADGASFEITTLRRDVATDGRRATVAFSTDYAEDAARRDFTFNALSVDPATLEVFDYFDGLTDLETRMVRFIGRPEERIAEDHLRIMRYFRFLARFGREEVDTDAYAACTAAAASLKSLSRERIADELMKLMAVEDPRFAISRMIGGGIFDAIIADFDPLAEPLLDRVIRREEQFGVEPLAIRRLLALLPGVPDKVDRIAKSLKLSNRTRKALVARVGKDTPKPKNIRALAYWHGHDAARDMVLLFGLEPLVAKMLAELDGWEVPTFPLKGGDLIAMGLEAGPEVAKTLQQIEEEWVAQSFPSKDLIEVFAKQAVLSS